MSSINGCINFSEPGAVLKEEVREAGKLLSHRGPDGFGMHRAGGVCFYHNRLAVRDVAGGKQPMSATFHGRRYTIVYNGEIYNSRELRSALSRQGAIFSTDARQRAERSRRERAEAKMRADSAAMADSLTKAE